MAESQPPMTHEDSIDSQDPHQHPEAKKAKSKRPASEDPFDDEHMEGDTGLTASLSLQILPFVNSD